MEYINELDKQSILSQALLDEYSEVESYVDKERYKNLILSRAKELGCKTEVSRLLSAQKKDITSPLRSYEAKFPDGTTLNTGKWQLTEQGIVTLGEKGLIVACPHPIFLTKVLVNIESGNFKAEIKFHIKNKWRTITVDKEVIASSSKIVKLASFGVNVTSESAKALVSYLSDLEALNEDKITEETSTSRFGWIHDDFNTFMPYGNNVKFDSAQNLQHLFDSIKQVGYRDKWYDLVKRLRKEGRFEVLMYLASSLASVLVEPCGALPFIVSIWGDSGRGKTVLLMLGASIWADPSEGQYLADAKATITAQEIRLDTLNNLPMLIDDMAQVRNQWDGDFSQLVYRWCAGQGKDRSNINLGLDRLKHWKNCILTNAEHSLVTETMTGGAINRIIDIEMGDGYIFEDGNAVCEVLRNSYGHCGFEFVNIIQDKGFDWVVQIQRDYAKRIKEYAKAMSVVKEEKQIIPMSIILTADKIATEYIYQDGIYLDFNKCFDLLKSQGDVSEHTRAYEFIRDFVISNGRLFKENETAEPRENCETYGYWLDKYKVAFIKTKFNKVLEKEGFQAKAFESWALKSNKIVASSTGKSTITTRVNGIPTKCIHFVMEDPDAFIDMEEVEDNPFL